MPDRNKILILENDDFLRELLGNLLHKKGNYILNGSSIERGVTNTKNQKISQVILGTSCPDFNDKSSINYLKQNLDPQIKIFVINAGSKKLPYIDSKKQMFVSELSVSEIIRTISG